MRIYQTFEFFKKLKAAGHLSRTAPGTRAAAGAVHGVRAHRSGLGLLFGTVSAAGPQLRSHQGNLHMFDTCPFGRTSLHLNLIRFLSGQFDLFLYLSGSNELKANLLKK